MAWETLTPNGTHPTRRAMPIRPSVDRRPSPRRTTERGRIPKGTHDQSFAAVEGELDARRGATGQAGQLLLRTGLPVQSPGPRPVPGSDGRPAGEAPQRDRDGRPDRRRSGTVPGLPPLTRPRPSEVPRDTRALRTGRRGTHRRASQVRG